MKTLQGSSEALVVVLYGDPQRVNSGRKDTHDNRLKN